MQAKHYVFVDDKFTYKNSQKSFMTAVTTEHSPMYIQNSDFYGNSFNTTYDHDSSSYVHTTPKKLSKSRKKTRHHWEDSWQYMQYRSEQSYLEMEEKNYNHSDFIAYQESTLSVELRAMYDDIPINPLIEFDDVLRDYSELFYYKSSPIISEARRWYSAMNEEIYYSRQFSVDDQSVVKEQSEQFGNILVNATPAAESLFEETNHIDYMHHIDYSSYDTVDDDFERSRSSSNQTSSCNSVGARLEVPCYVKTTKNDSSASFDQDDCDSKSEYSCSRSSYDSSFCNKSIPSLKNESFSGVSTPLITKKKKFDQKFSDLDSPKSLKNSEEKGPDMGSSVESEQEDSSYSSKQNTVMHSNVHSKQYGTAQTNPGFISNGSMPVQNALLEGRSRLECFRSNPASFSNCSLKDIMGSIIDFARDQHGSRFIQQRMEKSASGVEIEFVFKEIVSDNSVLFTLVTDVFGNYVVQKMLEFGTDKHRVFIAHQLKGHVLNLTTQMYGCRVIQKAVECVKPDLQRSMISELYGNILTCVKDQNGNHVIQKCIEHVPPENLNFIIDEFIGRVFELSSHPYGCRVIQRLMEHCSSVQTRSLMMEIFDNLSDLVKDQYGNYVIQHILDKKNHHPFPSQIIDYVFNNIFTLSSHKFASNVAEKCIHFSTKGQKETLVRMILRGSSTNGVDNLYLMMKDPFANYVVQKVVDSITGDLKKQLLIKMKPHFLTLKKLTYGKHMINKVDRWFKEAEPACTYVRCDEDFPPLD